MKKLGWMLVLAMVLMLAGRPAPAKAAEAQWVYNEDHQTWMYVDSIVAEEPEASDPYVDHWISYQGQWYHFLTGWQYVSGNWYFLMVPGAGGMCQDGLYYLDGERYSFSKSGAMHHDCWVKEVQTNGDGSTTTVWHYARSSGKLASGWLKIKGTWYYFSENMERNMVSGRICLIHGDEYFFDESGALKTNGWIQKRRYLSDNYWVTDWYYAAASGALYTEWHEINGKWYYFDPTDSGRMLSGGVYSIGSRSYSFAASGARQTGWVKYEMEDLYDTHAVWVYGDASGVLVTGWQEIGGKTYYFDDSSCLMLAGGGFLFSNDTVYVFADSGALITKAGWAKAGGVWYYILDNEDSTAATGWKTIGGKKYYFLPEDGSMATGLVVIERQLERFGDNGVYQGTVKKDTGWYQDGEDWYYFREGNVCVDWQEIGGRKYYFDLQFGYMYTGPATINDNGYFFYSGGSLATTHGWKKMTFEDGGVLWFYTYQNGECFHGWYTISGKDYYFDPDYYFMYAGGTYLIDGRICTFDDSGALIK